jgi:hypothetical protein
MKHRETGDPNDLRLTDKSETQFESSQKELRVYLNDKYGGKFDKEEENNNSNQNNN